jgi:lipopolysaccharide export system permease protein
VIKKLDTLIIKAFVGPFFATFFIALFVLVMQFFWLYIDDLVGKGLDLGTLAYLTGLVAVNWVPLALPLALLLSSIMTFGNLGESFELVAIKSAGIPLLRFMQPLFIVTVFIAGISFLFANNIMPIAALKLNTLKYDIIVSKPAFEIKEGVFYDKIEGYVIKIGQKSKDGNTIKNVIIYEKSYGLQDYSLIAESGTMKVASGNKLEFDLKNGWRYQEKGNRLTTNTEFID